MVDVSTVLLLLAGLCLCQANVIELTNENFDKVSIFLTTFFSKKLRSKLCEQYGVKL